MTIDKIVAALEKRIQKLEATVFPRKTSLRVAPVEPSSDDFKGAPGGIRYLYSKGYFRTPRRFGEIMTAVEAEGYLYTKQAIQNALTRMSKVGGPLVTLRRGGGKVYGERK
jgi:hypothetical protein